MTTTVSLKGYETAQTVLATELNSLAANNVSGLSGAGTGVVLDNTTLLDLYCDFIAHIVFNAAPTAGNVLGLYYSQSVDAGTTYETAPAAGATLPQTWKLVGNLTVTGTGTTQDLILKGWPMAPGKFKFQLVNSSGAALAASASTVKAYAYNLLLT